MSNLYGVIFLIVMFVAANLIWDFIKFLWDRHKFPYRWKCPQCNFSFETNVRETYEISKSSHNHSSTKEFKDTDPWRSCETLEACKRFHPGEPCMPGKNHPAAGDK